MAELIQGELSLDPSLEPRSAWQRALDQVLQNMSSLNPRNRDKGNIMGAFNPQLIAQLMQARAAAAPVAPAAAIPAGWQAALQGLNAGPYAAGGAMSPIPPGAQ